MKWLNQISIKVKVMLPICILGIVILLASISSLVNSKRLLQAGVVISQDCSKSIELLMDMSSELESMGKNMYGHCDAENSISKESFATTIHEKLESMDSYLGQFTRNYTQTVKRAADNKRRYAPGWVHSTCLLRGFPKGAAPHLAHDFAEQSVVCYTLCRRCPENTVAAGEGKGI